MALNEIIPFAGDPTALVQTQAAFDTDPQRIIGNQPGLAKASFVNKAMRQSSLIAAAVAQYIADNQITDVVDTLTPAAMSALLELVIKKEAYGAVTTVSLANSPFNLTADHAGLVLVDATAGNVVINLPAANVLAGLPYSFRRVDASANTATVNRAGADAIDEGGVSFLLVPKVPQGIRSNGVSAWAGVTPPAATQAEVNAGTDDAKFVTPLKLHNFLGRMWVDKTASRASSVTYYAPLEKELDVLVSANTTTSGGVVLSTTVNGLDIAQFQGLYGSSGGASAIATFSVPPGQSYSVTISGSGTPQFQTWLELN